MKKGDKQILNYLCQANKLNYNKTIERIKYINHDALEKLIKNLSLSGQSKTIISDVIKCDHLTDFTIADDD